MMSRMESRATVEDVYREIHPRLWRALVAYTADRDVASDAEAEAFAQVIRRGDDVRDIAAWVWRSSFKIAAGMLDRRRRADIASSAEEAGAGDESVLEFLALLDGLTTQQRACVALRYLGGLRAAEIATTLGTSEATVRTQLHRARTFLRTSLLEADRE
jgi:RNA polymerase sigma-70 factor (ECF subfamily)